MTACRLWTKYTVRQDTDSAGQHPDASSCNLFSYSLGSKSHSHKRFVLLLVVLSELRRMSCESYGLLEMAGKQGLQRPVNLHLRRAAGQHPALRAHCCAGQHLCVLPLDHCWMLAGARLDPGTMAHSASLRRLQSRAISTAAMCTLSTSDLQA